jgi:hypothetical protein
VRDFTPISIASMALFQSSVSRASPTPKKLLSLSLMRKLSRKWRNHSNIAKAK